MAERPAPTAKALLPTPNSEEADFPNTYRWLAAALGQLARSEEAREALEKASAIAPASFDFYVRQPAPRMRPEDHAHMLEGLRKAGWRG
jgi:adenylate cyclase